MVSVYKQSDGVLGLGFGFREGSGFRVERLRAPDFNHAATYPKSKSPLLILSPLSCVTSLYEHKRSCFLFGGKFRPVFVLRVQGAMLQLTFWGTSNPTASKSARL